MLNLPLDVLNLIQTELPQKDQSAFRRTSKYIARTDYNWKAQCCQEPTNYEIASWLFDKAQNYVPDPTYVKQIQQKNRELIRNNREYAPLDYGEVVYIMSFQDIDNSNDYIHIHLRKLGKITSAISGKAGSYVDYVCSRNDLIELLDRKKYVGGLKPSAVREVLARRNSCFPHKLSVDECILNKFRANMRLIDKNERDYESVSYDWPVNMYDFDDYLSVAGKQRIIDLWRQTVKNAPEYDPSISMQDYFENMVIIPGFPHTDVDDDDYAISDNNNPDFIQFQRDPETYISRLNQQIQYLYSLVQPSDLI